MTLTTGRQPDTARRAASTTVWMSASTVSVSPALRWPMVMTMSISRAPCSTLHAASAALAPEADAPRGKPTTEQTPTPLPSSSRAASGTWIELTHTVPNRQRRASSQRRLMSAGVLSGLRRVWSRTRASSPGVISPRPARARHSRGGLAFGAGSGLAPAAAGREVLPMSDLVMSIIPSTSGAGGLQPAGDAGRPGPRPRARDRTSARSLGSILFHGRTPFLRLRPGPAGRGVRGGPRPHRCAPAGPGKTRGAPFLLNFDENSIAGLRWQGLPEERLWDYAPVGCLENTLQADDHSGTVDVNINLAKAVELALNSGVNRVTDSRVGPATRRPERFVDYESFYRAVRAQLKAMLDRLLDAAAEADRIRATWEPTPYLSTMVGGCVEKRRDVTTGGPNHNYITVEGVGLATPADSVAAIKKLVYDEGRVKMAELTRALAADFEGHEELRKLLETRGPKSGNDDPYVDDIARDLSRFWTEEVFQRTSPATRRRFRRGYLSWNYWIGYGPLTGSTPDGRVKGRPLSNGICPSVGRGRNGPTAVIQSVGSLGLETAPNGASHTMSFSQAVLRDPEHRAKFAALLRAYGRVGGTALQVNVIDPETHLYLESVKEDG